MKKCLNGTNKWTHWIELMLLPFYPNKFYPFPSIVDRIFMPNFTPLFIALLPSIDALHLIAIKSHLIRFVGVEEFFSSPNKLPKKRFSPEEIASVRHFAFLISIFVIAFNHSWKVFSPKFSAFLSINNGIISLDNISIIAPKVANFTRR